MADELPPQRNNTSFDLEELLRDLLVQAGLQETITYRLTTPLAEARLLGEEHAASNPYVTLANPTTPERTAMRHSLLNSVLEVVAENSKHHDRAQVFEVGHIYMPAAGGPGEEAILPRELSRLAIVLTGPRSDVGWMGTDASPVDFYDLKGILESILTGLHIEEATFDPARHPAFRPGRVASLIVSGQPVGVFGQLHPLVVESYEIKTRENCAVLAADIDLDILLAGVPETHVVRSLPRFPPVVQDIAVVVDEQISANQVQTLIANTGHPMLTQVRLFDVYRGEQIGPGKKSLAFNLTYQSETRTLTDKVVAKQQQKILTSLERELGAKLRS
jgi:phenylalanyl-tRNA synthetase beta chain